MQGGAALTLGAAFGVRPAAAADTTIGFIYVGSRDDYGYNQAHAQGAAALKKMPGLKVVEEEKVAETDAVEKTMESMINLDGATLLFPTSFGYYNPHMIKLANKFPKLRFEHCGGLWTDKDPKNAGSYFGYIDEAQYISGIVAGYTSKGGKLGFVSGSATRASLTDGHTDGNRIGYFYRTVPNDNLQGKDVADWMTKHLKWKRVYIIDDQETYSQGLADGVQKILKSRHVTTIRDSISQTQSDFSSTIAKIPSNYQGIYIPWQLAPQAQAFGQQLKAAGKSHITLMGSDGLFAPGVWKIAGSYDSAFPVNRTSPVVQAYLKAHHGNGEYFGLPSYVAAQVVTGAVTRACKAGHGKTTRAAVRKQILKTKLKTSILGFPVAFKRSGEMKAPAAFGIYKIQKNGSFAPVG